MSHDISTTSPYRKVSTKTWADEKVRELTPIQPSGQALFLMLMVGPQTTSIPGVQPVGRLALAEMLEWGVEDFDKAFQEVFDKGLAVADWRARFLFVPKAIIHNLPQSPNVVKSWAATWAKVPECELKVKAWHTLHDALNAMGPAFSIAFKASCLLGLAENDATGDQPFDKPIGKPFGKPTEIPTGKDTDNQEQEQEKELKNKNIRTVPQKADSDLKEPPDYSTPKKYALGVRELIAAGVDRQHAQDWLSNRKIKRLPLTQTALDGVKREADKAGMTLPEAIACAAAEGWAGFKASWLTVPGARSGGTGEWWSSASTIIAEGKRFGIEQKPDEPMPTLRARIQAAKDSKAKDNKVPPKEPPRSRTEANTSGERKGPPAGAMKDLMKMTGSRRGKSS